MADAAYKTPHICKKVFSDGRVLSTVCKRPQTMKNGHEWWKYVYDEVHFRGAAFLLARAPNGKWLPYDEHGSCPITVLSLVLQCLLPSVGTSVLGTLLRPPNRLRERGELAFL